MFEAKHFVAWLLPLSPIKHKNLSGTPQKAFKVEMNLLNLNAQLAWIHLCGCKRVETPPGAYTR